MRVRLHVAPTREAVKEAGQERAQYRAHQPGGARELPYARELLARVRARARLGLGLGLGLGLAVMVKVSTL